MLPTILWHTLQGSYHYSFICHSSKSTLVHAVRNTLINVPQAERTGWFVWFGFRCFKDGIILESRELTTELQKWAMGNPLIIFCKTAASPVFLHFTWMWLNSYTQVYCLMLVLIESILFQTIFSTLRSFWILILSFRNLLFLQAVICKFLISTLAVPSS